MPKEVRDALTAAKVRQEKRPGRFADGNGLYLHVSETGARWWIWRGTIHARRRELGMGSVQLIPLAEAREIARTWRRIARAGGDPVIERDKDKRKTLTFADATRQVWSEQIKPHAKNPKHSAQWFKTLEVYTFPTIGSRPVHAIRQADILRILAPIWTLKPETARRVPRDCPPRGKLRRPAGGPAAADSASRTPRSTCTAASAPTSTTPSTATSCGPSRSR